MHRKVFNNNSVIGVSQTNTSPGKNLQVRQVESDCYRETVINHDCLLIGTWDVHTFFQEGKSSNVDQEMNRMKINLLGYCETRWPSLNSYNPNDKKVV